MELNRLRLFVSVCDELSFSRAAEREFVSQSSISHHVAALERELGAKLLDRSTRTVRITDVGARVLPIARQMLALEQAMHTAAAEPREKIRMAGNMSFGAQALAAVSLLRREYPDTEVDFVIRPFAERVSAVARGVCDIALIRGSTSMPGIQLEPLWSGDLAIAVARRHPLAARSTVDIGELADYPLLLPPRGEQVLIHKVVDEAFAATGRTAMMGPPVPQQKSSLLEIVADPRAWTVLYASTAPPSAEIVLLHEADARLTVTASAVLPDDREASAPVRALLSALREVGPRGEYA
ncbi:LysR family transcriptional regulator [Tsukamurella sp. 8F]|uniref:LysR substrate-binding domain-containing protein n=1 Tax=unclassified Tsukamurella TaxID=2633480 RepID=UPI0023B97476|nr:MULTISPECIES: LysR family transcriptional regulator [unclassified Tsukamurella]MDF0529563.1 LysR family transcriptional regulator [Tsukamurella sp. 8J]MDF0585749.1 LysR family transcriptional regulator [Tsukamurella sp. 8F]